MARVAGNEEVAAEAEAFSYPQQEDFPQTPDTPQGEAFVFYADVWERPVTALEDSDLMDPGLHGADTCTRTQTMGQIKWCPSDKDPEDETDNPPLGTAELSLQLHEKQAGGDPCDPCADQVDLEERVGNYLFRVELHDVQGPLSAPTEITLKWSSENGAEHFEAESAPDEFKAGDWIYEFYSDTSEKHLGVHLVDSFSPQRGELHEDYPDTPPVDLPYVRRWDGYVVLEHDGASWSLATDADGIVRGKDKENRLSTTSSENARGHVSLGAEFEVNLEHLKLTLVLTDRVFVAGDFWLGVVREAEHQNGSVIVDGEAPAGVTHHYLTLANVASDGELEDTATPQLRQMNFPPLTDLRAGDVGYETSCPSGLFDASHDTVEKALHQICEIAAEHIGYQADCEDGLFKDFVGTVKEALDKICAIQAAHVGFSKPCDSSIYQGVAEESLKTVEDALQLLCNVRAEQIGFTPDGDCTVLAGASTVAEALNTLCKRPSGGGCRVTVGKGGEFEGLLEAIKSLLEQGFTDICICLLPGDHELAEWEPLDKAELRIDICGCGAATTRLTLGEQPFVLNVHSFSLKGVTVRAEKTHLRWAGRNLTLADSHLLGLDLSNDIALLELDGSEQVHVENNVVEAYLAGVFDLTRTVLTDISEVLDLFAIAERGAFVVEARAVAEKLAGLNPNQRRQRATRLRISLDQNSDLLTDLERFTFPQFVGSLLTNTVDVAGLASNLNDIRTAAIAARPAAALLVASAEAATMLDNNRITGLLSLYGLPGGKSLDPSELHGLKRLASSGRIRFVGTVQTLQLRNNRLTRLVVSERLIETLRSVLDNQGGSVTESFATALLSDNVIELPDNHLIALNNGLSATRFHARQIGVLGFVAGDNAVYMGTVGTNSDSLLFSVTRLATETATLEMTIGT